MSTPQEELAALRRMAELEDRAAGSPRPTDQNSVAATPAQSEQTAWDKASKGDIVAGLPATRMIVGAVAPVVGAFQVGANIGDWISQKMGQDPVLGKYVAEKVAEYEASKKRGMAALGDTGADIAGPVASLATGGLALKNIVPATTYKGKVLQGAAVGAAAGATTPSSIPGLGQTGEQALLGATLGGGIPAVAPLVSKTAQVGYRTLVEPWKNPQAIKGRVYLEAAGPNPQQMVNALRDPRAQIVPGSMPTAGEAGTSVGRAEWAALQKSAERVAPSDYLARDEARKAAQLAQVRTVGQNRLALQAAEATRDANALVNYALANQQGIDPAMATAMQPQLESLLRRPSIEQARQTAMRLAAEQDLALTNFGSLEGLDWLKKGLDNQISTAAKQTSAIGKADLRSLLQTKQDLLATIQQIAPAYDAARGAFARDSIPINQMQVGQYLENKLIPALGEEGKLRSASFAGAVKDAPSTLKRSLEGSPRFTELTQVLTPVQLSAVNSVVDDLARGAKFEAMAQKGAAAGPSAMDVATQSVEKASGGSKIPNPLSRVVTIANAILGRLEGKINKKLALEIAQEMLSPTQAANALEAAMKRGAASPTMNALGKNRIPLTVGGTQTAINSRD